MRKTDNTPAKPRKCKRGGVRPGAGRPSGEPTASIRVYVGDKEAIYSEEHTPAEAVRSLLNTGRLPGQTEENASE